MAKQLKKWQGWALFGGAMIAVFLLGLLVSSLMERRAEVASVFNNKRTEFTDSIVAQNEKFKADYPREYETWAMTEDTSFVSKYNSSQEVDVLEARSRDGGVMGRLRFLAPLQHAERTQTLFGRPEENPAYRQPRYRWRC